MKTYNPPSGKWFKVPFPTEKYQDFKILDLNENFTEIKEKKPKIKKEVGLYYYTFPAS